MKKNMILAILALSATTLMAQVQDTVKNDLQNVNADTIVVQKKQVSTEEAHLGAVAALYNQDFVLQADEMVSVRNRIVAEVDSGVNFIAVKGNKGVWQIAPPASEGDSTVHGGVTMPLDILSCDVKTDKRGNVTCYLSAMVKDSPKQFRIRLSRKNNERQPTTKVVKASSQVK